MPWPWRRKREGNRHAWVAAEATFTRDPMMICTKCGAWWIDDQPFSLWANPPAWGCKPRGALPIAAERAPEPEGLPVVAP